MYGLPIYENHFRATMKFHYAREGWKRPREKKQVQRKAIHLVTSFLLYTSKNTIQMSLYGVLWNCTSICGGGMKRGHKSWSCLELTKGYFSLCDIHLDSLSVEPWIQTKRFQPSEGCPSAPNSSHCHCHTNHLARKHTLSYAFFPNTKDVSWFKLNFSGISAFSSQPNVSSLKNKLGSIVFCIPSLSSLRVCSTHIYTSLTDAII